MGQGLQEDEVWLDLTPEEAALLTLKSARYFAPGTTVLSRTEADAVAWEIAGSFDHERMAPDGILIAEATAVILLVSRLGDSSRDRALRLRASSGDVAAAYELGMRKFVGPFFSYPLDAVALLRQAYEAGIRAAGHDLARLSEEQSGMLRQERIVLLEELALGGDPAAALEILYMPGEQLERSRLLRILGAVREGSAEAEEWYERLSSEPGES